MNYITFNKKVKKLFNMPPSKVIKKVNKKICTTIIDKVTEHIDYKMYSYTEHGIRVLYSYINTDQLDFSMIEDEQSKFLLSIYINHYFDLLGSGFLKFKYNFNIAGIKGIKDNIAVNTDGFDSEGEWLNNILIPPHVKYCRHIWECVDRNYDPIDWQMDFKSGYRYSQKIWYKKQPVGKIGGADIKVPWEISRMQHLLQLAVLSLAYPSYSEKVIKEFKNQVYDFAATNPVRMGSNWKCTMDVAIRAANLLMAHDIVKSIDKNGILDEKFESFFSNFIYEHGNFIIHNLEWYDGENNNHYLSDICGLLFISAYLERNEITDAWLVFSIQEIISCMERQFHTDGTNFEASTSYHRLSGEIMIYSTALIYGLLKTDKIQALKNYNPRLVRRLLNYKEQRFDLNDDKFFPNWYLDRLFKAGCFAMDITKANGEIPQIGDNDSGRLFKFSPVGMFLTLDELTKKYDNLREYKGIKGIDNYFDEDILDHSTFVSAMDGLFNYGGFEQFSIRYPLEKNIIECLSKGFKLEDKYSNNKVQLWENDSFNLEFNKITEIRYKNYTNKDINITDIKFIAYPDFGIYLFKGSQFYLSVFAGDIGQNGNGGHSHNDKLSFELNLCGNDIFIDPGTYVYTPFPEKRNMFRSIKAHNVPIVSNWEQNEFLDLFSVKNETSCGVLGYGNGFIRLYVTYRDIKVIREFSIYNDKLVINDSCNKDFYVNLNFGQMYSNGYGKLVNSHNI